MLISEVVGTKGSHVVRIRTTDNVLTAVKRLAEHRIGALVVEDEWMHPLGIFSERDFVNAVARHGAEALAYQVRQLMSSPMVTCRSDDRIDAALAIMTIRKIRHLPVIDGDHLAGIVSIGDLVKYRLDEKELEANVLLDIFENARLTTRLSISVPIARYAGAPSRQRCISVLEGSVSSTSFFAVSTPATGSPFGSSAPICTSTDAWSQ